MKSRFVAFLILGAVVSLEANPIDTRNGEIRAGDSALDERGLLDDVLKSVLGSSSDGGILGSVIGSGGIGDLLGGGQDGGLVGGGVSGDGSGGGLLGGLLGGGSSGGGLLSGLLGGGSSGGGLLGGLLGGGNSSLLGSGGLLGGLLGGGSSGGGLLGGLLGGGSSGGGLLGGLLGGGSSGGGLLGGLLGGSNGTGLLGGLLGGNGGLLGSLLGGESLIDLLNKVLCLLTRFGLNVVVDLLKGLNVDKLLGLNTICKDPKGGDLLSILFKDGTNLPLVDKVLCLTKGIGAKPVLDVIQKLGVNKVLPFLNVNCSGVPLFESNSTASDIFSKLLASLDVSLLIPSGINAVVDLAKQLALAKVVDVQKVISQLLCLIRQLRLDVVVGLIKKLSLDVVLNITNTYCKAGQPLFDNLVKVTGLSIPEVISSLGCLVNSLGLTAVEARITQNQLPLLVKLNSMCSAQGGGDLIDSLLKGGLSLEVLIKIPCVVSGLKADVVMDLFTRLGADKLIRLQEIACPTGSQLFNLTSLTGRFFIELVLRLGADATANLKASDIPRLEKIISSLTGVSDVTTVIDNILCSIQKMGVQTALYTIESLGLNAAFSLSNQLCGVGISNKNSLKILVDNIGSDVALGLINQLGVNFVVTLANFLVVDGQFLGAELLKQTLCVLQAIGVQALEDIFKQSGSANFLEVYKYFCPNGQPLRLNANAEFFGQAVINCRVGTTPECASSLETAATVSCDRDCSGACQSLPLKPDPKSLCKSFCSSSCLGGK